MSNGQYEYAQPIMQVDTAIATNIFQFEYTSITNIVWITPIHDLFYVLSQFTIMTSFVPTKDFNVQRGIMKC